jgi:hypothetical protein
MTKIEVYKTEDTVPISKLKSQYITTFFSNLKEFKQTILNKLEIPNTKLFLEPSKGFLIENEVYCFIYLYNSVIIQNELYNLVKQKEMKVCNKK